MEEEKNGTPEYINQVQFTVQVHVAGTKWVQNFYEVALKVLKFLPFHEISSVVPIHKRFLSGGSTLATVINTTYRKPVK